MSLEELMVEHIKALNENTKAIRDYTKALTIEQKTTDVEHTKNSACGFCGITYKTLETYMSNGMITPCRKKNGRREYFREVDLVALCESKKLYSGTYGELKGNPSSLYYAG